jgi:hypothetical protein
LTAARGCCSWQNSNRENKQQPMQGRIQEKYQKQLSYMDENDHFLPNTLNFIRDDIMYNGKS